MRFFGGKKRETVLDRLRGGTWRCASCGFEHEGMFDLAAFAPDFWTGAETREPNRALRMDGDFLSEDFCVLGGDSFFVRCVIEIPVHGLTEKFGLGVWSSLSRTNFDLYIERFDDGDYAGLGPWTGWFSSSLVTFPDTLEQPCCVHPQLDRQRPVITLDDPDHPLSVAQDQGVSPERVLEIYAACGHASAAG
jgi:hypothetical protein